MPDLTPEQKARENIDAMLVASGWVIQGYKTLNLSAGLGVAVREVPLTTGPCDYLLLVDRKTVGVVEAKKKGISIEPEDLERTPFNPRGGLGKVHQLFGEQLPTILDELNLKLVA